MRSRRSFLSSLAALGAASLADSPSSRLQAADEQQRCTLGFSTYGAKTLTTEKAIAVLSEIGYDSLEIIVRKDWDADSATLAAPRRKELRKRLADAPLKLSSLMEHVFPTSSAQQQTALHRLRLATEVAHDLSPESPALVQTVLGSGDFQKRKTVLRDRLGDWLKIAEATKTTIAIKPHRGGIVSTPSEAAWLLDQLGKPNRLRMVYDYSHYIYRNLSLDKTVDTALPYTAHVAVKDAVKQGDKVVFRLPGETAAIDFARLIRRFNDGGYRGDINCEVSGMVWSKPDYDPISAARTCYQNMAAAFRAAGIRRA